MVPVPPASRSGGTGDDHWYQLFGDLATELARHGPSGWLILAAAIAPSAALSHQQLGIIAGQLQRTRCRRTIPTDLSTGSYGLLRTGTVTVTAGSGPALTLTPGATWSPQHTLRRASRRAVLIHITAHEIRQLVPIPTGQ